MRFLNLPKMPNRMCYDGIVKSAQSPAGHQADKQLRERSCFFTCIFFAEGMVSAVNKLTAKQQAWIDYYKHGKTATEAARLAGYKAKDDNGFQSIGSENLRKLAVYIAERDKILETPRIADMEEINAFWTNVMRDKDEETKDRLKASELRAKAAGAFVQQIEHSGTLEVENPLAGLTTEELRKLADDG